MLFLPLLASTSIPGTTPADPFRHLSTCHAGSVVVPAAPPPPPQLSAPPRNRYNYASPDCSARIHSASEQTQHASSLLQKSRDRYMLTPCKADQHWVIVELCDEIRVEAIELALWEFYSGVVRDIRLSASDDADKDFHQVAAFVGRNVRGAQVFTLPQPTAFHRFIRLDFDSFYGSEYYCPVSHLKVFGMNQMEAFKWEQKLNPPEKLHPTVEQSKPAPARLQLAQDPQVEELEEMIHLEATRQTSNTSDTRGDTSESIYATITRRLNALEGNSSLIARYIEEQGRIIRATSAAFAQDWDDWRLAREADEHALEMRQEDRLGRVLSLCSAMEVERQAMAVQLRLLTEELSAERRRGFAHTAIIVIIIILGAVSRSSVIETVLKPLIAEARRRKDSLRPNPNPRRWSRNPPRRPGTPNKRRPYPSVGRSFSSTDPFAQPGQGPPFKRLAQSAHLHQVKDP